MAGWIGWALSLAALWLGLSTALGGDGKSRADEDLRHHALYGASFYRQPNCRGKPQGPYINFGCSDNCWPAWGARSIRLDGHYFYKADKHGFDGEHGEHNRHGIVDNIDTPPWLDYLHFASVHKRGPEAVAFGEGACGLEERQERIVIPPWERTWCQNLQPPAYGFTLRLQRLCRKKARKPVLGVPPPAENLSRLIDWFEADENPYKSWPAPDDGTDKAAAVAQGRGGRGSEEATR